MIRLFRERTSAEADWVEAALHGMVLGYERVVVTPAEAASQFGTDVSLPILRDGERLASGQPALVKFLEELEKFAEDWHLYQGDACYIREDRDAC